MFNSNLIFILTEIAVGQLCSVKGPKLTVQTVPTLMLIRNPIRYELKLIFVVFLSLGI